jgi:hypothetical protein
VRLADAEWVERPSARTLNTTAERTFEIFITWPKYLVREMMQEFFLKDFGTIL